LARFRDGGLDALEPRSRRPKTTPIAASDEVRERVIELWLQLTANGLDAGPVTIAWHLQRWLRARPVAASSAQLQRQLDEFCEHYNEHRSHRALDRRTPGEAYRATPKAVPAGPRAQQHYRLRYDRLDAKGKMSLRRAGKMHHLATGAANARKRVLAFSDDTHATVVDLTTGEVLSVHLIQPDNSYWRNQNKEPGRWPGSQNRDS
jgi:hypothetical protein